MNMNHNNEYREKCIKNLNFEITGCLILCPIAMGIITLTLYYIIPISHTFPLYLVIQSCLGTFGFGAIFGYLFIDKILDISWIKDKSKNPHMWIIRNIKESTFFLIISILVGYVGGLLFGIPLYMLLKKGYRY